VGRVEVLGLGQRPAARGQAGADPGHVGIARRMVGGRRDVPGNGFPDRCAAEGEKRL